MTLTPDSSQVQLQPNRPECKRVHSHKCSRALALLTTQHVHSAYFRNVCISLPTRLGAGLGMLEVRSPDAFGRYAVEWSTSTHGQCDYRERERERKKESERESHLYVLV